MEGYMVCVERCGGVRVSFDGGGGGSGVGAGAGAGGGDGDEGAVAVAIGDGEACEVAMPFVGTLWSRGTLGSDVG